MTNSRLATSAMVAALLGSALQVQAQTAATALIGEDFASNPRITCPAMTATPAGAAPDPRCVLGQMTVTSGKQVIRTPNYVLPRGHYVNPTGPCIVIAASGVVIEGSEIGPCGTATETDNFGYGIEISSPDGVAKPGNITIRRNVIHDVATGVLSHMGTNPIYVDRNYFFNVRNTPYKAHDIQLSNVSGGTVGSKITCNVSDGYVRSPTLVAPPFVDDHINLYNVLGVSTAQPVEVAYNKIRATIGGGMRTGSGIMVGDSPAGGGGTGGTESGFYYVHDNIIVQANNTGIGVAGGHDIRIEDNWIDQRGPSAASMTGWPLAIKNYKQDSSCYNVAFKRNKLTPANLWSYPPDETQAGKVVKGITGFGATNMYCAAVDFPTTGADANDLDNAALGAAFAPEGSQATFSIVISACN